MSGPDIKTWAGFQPFPWDVPEEDARRIALEVALDAVQEQTPGVAYVQTPDAPVFERMDPIMPGATIYGCDDEGNWIGDPRDYAIAVRVKVYPLPLPGPR